MLSSKMLRILKQCEKEIEIFPEEVREDLADAIARLEHGHTLSMPLSRPMPDIGKGVHELRFKDRSGIYRVIYVLVKSHGVYLLHGFKKTSQKTPLKNIKLAQKRLKGVLS